VLDWAKVRLGATRTLSEARGIKPSYDQKQFSRDEIRGKLRLIASREPDANAVKIYQDVRLFATLLDGETIKYELPKDRYAWVQIARGTMKLNGTILEAGDGAAASEESGLELSGTGEALLFDLN